MDLLRISHQKEDHLLSDHGFSVVTETPRNEPMDRGITGLWKMSFQGRAGIESGFKTGAK